MPHTKKILVADDDAKILKAVGEALRQEGYGVFTAADGMAALELCQKYLPDLVILDVMMPGMDGLEVCGRLRSQGHQMPVLILSARGDETDRVVGFRLGADDYLTKPFSVTELVLRVRAILRRSGAHVQQPSARDRLTIGPLEMDRSTFRTTMRGQVVELTPREFSMLWILAAHPGQVFSREMLVERVWDTAFDGDQSAVTVYIRRLREKLERTPGEPEHIKTVWGVGYKFDP